MPGTLTGSFPLLDDSPATGNVEIEAIDLATKDVVPEIVDLDGNKIFSGRLPVPLVDGAFSVGLPAADDPVNPQGFVFRVTPNLDHTNLEPKLVVILDGQTTDLAEAVTPPEVSLEYAELVGQAAAAAARAEAAAAQTETAGGVYAGVGPPPEGTRFWVVFDDDGNFIDMRQVP